MTRGFFEQFTQDFFSSNDELKVTQAQRQDAIAVCRQADENAALACIVPFEGSGQRTLAAIPGSRKSVIAGAPHGSNTSHAEEWNRTLLGFLVNQVPQERAPGRLASLPATHASARSPCRTRRAGLDPP